MFRWPWAGFWLGVPKGPKPPENVIQGYQNPKLYYRLTQFPPEFLIHEYPYPIQYEFCFIFCFLFLFFLFYYYIFFFFFYITLKKKMTKCTNHLPFYCFFYSLIIKVFNTTSLKIKKKKTFYVLFFNFILVIKVSNTSFIFLIKNF